MLYEVITHTSPVEDWSKEVERKMLDKELGQVIRKFTDDLSEKYRVVFVLSDVEGLSNEETAQILGLTVPAVKSRLHRARLEGAAGTTSARGSPPGTCRWYPPFATWRIV